MEYREPIIAQYLAALAMLKQSILACPETIWDRPDDPTTFSQVAYHALFFTHLYLQESEHAFRVWSGHRDAYRFEADGTSERQLEVIQVNAGGFSVVSPAETLFR